MQLQEQYFPHIFLDVWFERELILILITAIIFICYLPCSFICFYLWMSLIFSLCIECFVRAIVIRVALTVFSPSYLSAHGELFSLVLCELCLSWLECSQSCRWRFLMSSSPTCTTGWAANIIRRRDMTANLMRWFSRNNASTHSSVVMEMLHE